jgi:gluconokinase
MIIILMGVSGSGKTTVGCLLAARLGCIFLDADSLHSPANIDKMTRGIPLTDVDRASWLAVIHERIAHSFQTDEPLVVACSALKQQYRNILGRGVRVTWIYLKGSQEILHERLQQRQHHFMKGHMLAGQLADLEEPSDAIVIDISLDLCLAADQIHHAMARRGVSSDLSSWDEAP